MTATGREARRSSPMTAATSVDLPAPGGPVIPTVCARPARGYSCRIAASAIGVRFSTAVSSRASARRSPRSAVSASSVARAVGSGPASPTLALVPGADVLAEEGRDLADRRARPEHARDAGLAERLDIVVGDDPAGRHEHVVEAALAHQRGDPRDERHVGAAQDRQADDVDVLLERRVHDHLGRLAKARVDDLEALVAEAAGEDLRAAVVAVE